MDELNEEMQNDIEKYKPQGEMVIYRTDDGKASLDVILENETVWLTQKQMAILFDTTPQNITMHIKNVYKDGELAQVATCKDYLQVQQEGSRAIQRMTKYYNLDVILAVGYRVRSQRGVEFRQWASERLKEYIVKGYTIDAERLKGNAGTYRQTALRFWTTREVFLQRRHARRRFWSTANINYALSRR